ncbi:restriction endonuclease [Streptomyces mangrovi]|uniref:restriction endonuclease n=1 Tax=Streptomyces mangrovi TaxID=1206892 RepID=UPI00399C8CE0
MTGQELRSFKDLSGISPRTRSVAVFSRRTVLNVAMLLRDSIVARQVRAYLLDAERNTRPHPVDNLFHIDLDALDERITRISTQTAGRLIGQTIVPMLNHLIHASGEQRRELTAIREDLERVKRTLQGRELTGAAAAAAAAVDAMGRREFEDHVAGLCRRDGCTVANTGSDEDLSAELVGRTADGRRLVVRCEHSATHRAVESGTMWEFAGMAKLEHEAEVALFVTNSTFTTAALGLAARHGITAVHRALLEAWSTGTALQVLR